MAKVLKNIYDSMSPWMFFLGSFLFQLMVCAASTTESTEPSSTSTVSTETTTTTTTTTPATTTSTSTASTTSSAPSNNGRSIKESDSSDMMVGLAAGFGGIFGFLVLCCIIWCVCCGDACQRKKKRESSKPKILRPGRRRIEPSPSPTSLTGLRPRS